MFLAGEAGIGKSRLIKALRERIADEPHTRIAHRASPYHANTVLWPFIDQLERAAAFERDDTPPMRLSKLVSLLPKGPTISPKPSHSSPLSWAYRWTVDTRRSTSRRRPRSGRHWRCFLAQLEGLAQQRPVLSVLEDAHWFDPTSIELLGLILERAQRLQVLIIITFRLEMTPPWPSLPARNGPDAQSPRAPDSRGSCRANVRWAPPSSGSGGRDRREDRRRSALHRRTHPRPCWSQACCATRPRVSRWSRRVPFRRVCRTLSWPGSIISASAKDLVQVGAAIGREFTYELLDAVAAREPADLDQALARLVKSELVFQRGTPPEAVYAFKHALVQDVAYASMLRVDGASSTAGLPPSLRRGSPILSRVSPSFLRTT